MSTEHSLTVLDISHLGQYNCAPFAFVLYANCSNLLALQDIRHTTPKIAVSSDLPRPVLDNQAI